MSAKVFNILFFSGVVVTVAGICILIEHIVEVIIEIVRGNKNDKGRS